MFNLIGVQTPWDRVRRQLLHFQLHVLQYRYLISKILYLHLGLVVEERNDVGDVWRGFGTVEGDL